MFEEALTDAERTHCGTLGVHLVDICKPSSQSVRCDFVSKLVAEISSLLTSAAHLSACIGYVCVKKGTQRQLR